MSFNEMFERLMRKKQAKAEGRFKNVDGRPRKHPVVRGAATTFDELMVRGNLEITARDGRVGNSHRSSRTGLWKRRYGG